MTRLRNAVLLVGLLFAGAAQANAGVPMLALAWPAQWLTLVPIIVIECVVLSRTLGIPFRQLIRPVGKANFLSTLVGIPLAWLAMLLLAFVVGLGLSLVPSSIQIPQAMHYALFPLTSAWVTGTSPWQVYFAFVILAVPFCAASVFIEEGVLQKAFPENNQSVIHTTTVKANVISYIMLTALAAAFPLAG